jgi:hypothetical protein
MSPRGTVRPSALALVAVGVAGVVASGCGAVEPPPRPSFRVALLVEGDPGQPLEGATVVRAKQVVATTHADGRVELTLDGDEGTTVDAEVKCPAGHTSPARPVSMRLTRVADGRAPEFKVSCPPTERHVVVAIVADNGPLLPVVYLGKEIAKTDASGAAHFVVDAAPGTQFNVTLDTSGNAKLKPPSPSKPFTVGQTDEVVVFEQKFEVEKKKVVFVKHEGPRCLTCGRGGS